MAYSISVSLSKRRLTLYKDGKVVKEYPVGVGKSGHPHSRRHNQHSC